MSAPLPDPSITPPGPATFEPTLVRGLVLAILGLLGSAGLGLVVLSGEQTETLVTALVGVVTAVSTLVPLVQALWTRRAVYSPVTAAALLHTPPPLEYVDHDHHGAEQPTPTTVALDDVLAGLPRQGEDRPPT